jgi:hypothetical protein
MPPFILRALCCLAICVLPSSALLAQPAASSAAAASAATAASPANQPLPDPAAFVAREFGGTFTVDPKVPPLFGDLDGDGNEDVVLVATSTTPLLSEQQLHFKVEDPYDGYFGTGDVKITATFTLHFDDSARDILIVFGWRLPPVQDPKQESKHPTKFVLINTPFETLSINPNKMLLKNKKSVQAMETVDSTKLHSLIFWDGKHWHWSGQDMEGDEPLMPRKH